MSAVEDPKGKGAHRTLLVNVMGGPGLGKKDLCEALALRMGALGLSCTVLSGRAKEWIAQGRAKAVAEGRATDQASILDVQRRAVEDLWGEVDVVFTDCSALQGVQYVSREGPGRERALKNALADYERRAPATVNFFVVRGERPYEQEGRAHTEKEAVEIDRRVLACLEDHGIPFALAKVNGPDAEAEVAKCAAAVARRFGLAPAGAPTAPPGAAPSEAARADEYARELSEVGWPRAHVGFVRAALLAGWPWPERAFLVRSLPERELAVDAALRYLRNGAWELDRAMEWLGGQRDSEQHWKATVCLWAEQRGVPVPEGMRPDEDWEERARKLAAPAPRSRRRAATTPAEERKRARETPKLEEEGAGSAAGAAPRTGPERKRADARQDGGPRAENEEQTAPHGA